MLAARIQGPLSVPAAIGSKPAHIGSRIPTRRRTPGPEFGSSWRPAPVWGKEACERVVKQCQGGLYGGVRVLPLGQRLALQHLLTDLGRNTWGHRLGFTVYTRDKPSTHVSVEMYQVGTGTFTFCTVCTDGAACQRAAPIPDEQPLVATLHGRLTLNQTWPLKVLSTYALSTALHAWGIHRSCQTLSTVPGLVQDLRTRHPIPFRSTGANRLRTFHQWHASTVRRQTGNTDNSKERSHNIIRILLLPMRPHALRPTSKYSSCSAVMAWAG